MVKGGESLAALSLDCQYMTLQRYRVRVPLPGVNETESSKAIVIIP